VPAGAAEGSVRIGGKVQWLMCKDVCIPGEAALELELPVRTQAGPSSHAGLFELMARGTPRSAIDAQAGLAGRTLSLVFEGPKASRAEFFPYQEGWLSAPAPQKLYRIDGSPLRWRLELAAAEGADAAALERARVFEATAGVIVLDGEPFEVRALRASAEAPAGTLVATAEGAASGVPAGGSKLLQPGVASAAAGPNDADGLTLAVAVGFGLVGGLLLNLMPCVFPVIGLKVLSFTDHASGHRGRARRGALAFAGGVLLSFWVLAALLLALREAGQSAGWGFQLQSPAFVSMMALLFVALGLNFSGVYEIGARMTQLGNLDPLSRRSGSGGSFASGVLAVLVATPCTAPFMGSAMGFTLGRSALELGAVFTAIAIGMALPYVVLGFVPQALAWLPRPGRWMESFKQFLAFPMYATAAWLAWVLGQQAGIDAVLSLGIAAVLLGLAAWAFGRFVQAGGATRPRGAATVLAAAALFAALWMGWPADVPGESGGPVGATKAPGAGSVTDGASAAWAPWSEDTVSRALGDGRGVFVDFTAAWCVTCQANKKLVLDRDPVVSEMAKRRVLRLRADWTSRDPAITAALARHGRNGVPLYLLFVPGEPSARVLPEILTAGLVMEALSAVR
jgi:thiol:disulfide interchange protein DsbD